MLETEIQWHLRRERLKIDAQIATKPIRKRHFGIDAFRYGMAFCVVLLHVNSQTLSIAGYPYWPTIAQMSLRGAVPFYLISSGYFLSPERKDIVFLITKPLLRLAPVYVFWMLCYFIYLRLYQVVPWNWTIRDLISGGAAFHLWFLPALGVGLALVGVGVRFAGMTITGLICLILAAYSLANGSYHDTLGISGVASPGRTMIAPAYVFIGLLISRSRWTMKPFLAAISVVFAFALLISEEVLIQLRSTQSGLISHDFVLSTFLLGTSLFLLANAVATGRAIRRLASLGKTSLGIYVVHMMIVWPLTSWFCATGLLRSCIIASLAFFISTLTIITLRRIRFLSPVLEQLSGFDLLKALLRLICLCCLRLLLPASAAYAIPFDIFEMRLRLFSQPRYDYVQQSADVCLTPFEARLSARPKIELSDFSGL